MQAHLCNAKIMLLFGLCLLGRGFSTMHASQCQDFKITSLIAATPGQDDCTTQVTATVSGGTPPYTYKWSTGQTNTVNNTVDTIEVNTIAPIAVAVTDMNGCTATHDAVAVTLPPNAISVAISPPAITLCESGTTPLVAVVSGNTQGITYQWSPSAETTQTIFAKPTETTCYTVTVTNTTTPSCTAMAQAIVSPKSAVTIEGKTSICRGSTLTLTAKPAEERQYTYEWTGPNSFQAVTQTISIPNIDDINQGEYTVKITDCNKCTSDEAKTEVTVTDCAELNITLCCPEKLSTQGTGDVVITIMNNGTAQATDIKVIDELPSCLTPQSPNIRQLGWDITTDGQTITAEKAILDPGSTTFLILPIKANCPPETTAENMITVESSTTSQQTASCTIEVGQKKA